MESRNYLDYAENDYEFFMFAYSHGAIANEMASMAQNACEKYLKHVVNEYYEPSRPEEAGELNDILHTHSLRKIIRFMENSMGITFDRDTRSSMLQIDGFYFTARYPGNYSSFACRSDIDECAEALKNCREAVFGIVRNIENANEEPDIADTEEEDRDDR